MKGSIIVTGATEGIGRATALMLAGQGWSVFGTGRTADGSDRPAEGARSGMLHMRRADVRVRAEIDAVIEEAGNIGRLVGLVNCAGLIAEPGVPFADATEQGIIDQVWTNLVGTIYATQSFLARGPRQARFVVMVASTSGMRPSPGWPVYGATKAAMINLGQSLAAEHETLNVITVAPGRTATRLRALIAPDEDPAQIMQPEAVAAEIVAHIDQAVGGYASRYTGDPIIIRNPESA